MLSLADDNGQVLKQVSSGYLGFKNTKKSTPYAAQQCAEAIAKAISDDYQIGEVELWVRGVGAGRDIMLKRMLSDSKFVVSALVDKTPLSHGGCRPRKCPRK